jgi:hypothetical protein
MTSPQFFRTPWRKSSRSSGGGGQCVEVAAMWRRSSHSGSSGQECVEVAPLPRDLAVAHANDCEIATAEGDRVIAMRDSKNPGGPVLSFTPAEWAAFLGGAKTGAFDLPR